ncbi:MAG: TetR family transcriptional regulator C-terminal domain-containing protein, partial [Pseudomonadota bacterium]
TGLKKGAFYHHFPSKQALAYAVLEEVITGSVAQRWIEGMAASDDPIQALEGVLDAMAEGVAPGECFCGCPLNNLAQEMAPLDAGFQERIQQVFDNWIGLLAEAFARGQQNGTISPDVDVQGAATFVVATVEGCTGLTKANQRLDTFSICRRQLSAWLQTLRP